MVRDRLWMVASFVLAFLLTILPLPVAMAPLMPPWVLLALLYWIVIAPFGEKLNIETVWGVGLLLDLLSSSPLGEHAFALVVVAYLAFHWLMRFRMYPLLQQSLAIGAVLWLYQLILYSLHGFMHETSFHALAWLASVCGMLLWPWLSLFSRHRQYSFQLR